MKVKILGTSYSISYKSPTEDPLLKECDGYCDESSKKNRSYDSKRQP